MEQKYMTSNEATVSLINRETGKVTELGTLKNFESSVVVDYSELKLPTRGFRREVTITCDKVRFFQEQLGKLYYMKIHAKTKRLKKKYTKLFKEKQEELWMKTFGFKI